MKYARIRQYLIIATLVVLVSGCSTWAGPPVMVENRGTLAPEPVKVHQVRHVSAAKSPKAPAPSYCDGQPTNLIHPLHYDASTACPLLKWDIRTVKDEPGR